MRLLTDGTPLRENPAFRRLWLGTLYALAAAEDAGDAGDAVYLVRYTWPGQDRECRRPGGGLRLC